MLVTSQLLPSALLVWALLDKWIREYVSNSWNMCILSADISTGFCLSSCFCTCVCGSTSKFPFSAWNSCGPALCIAPICRSAELNYIASSNTAGNIIPLVHRRLDVMNQWSFVSICAFLLERKCVSGWPIKSRKDCVQSANVVLVHEQKSRSLMQSCRFILCLKTKARDYSAFCDITQGRFLELLYL